jgi:DNA-directed RNA polymerase specialized sigma24 family protein
VDFTEYVAARGRALWRAAWLLTGDAKLAEDLVQTALTKAWPALAGEVPTQSLPDVQSADPGHDLDLVRALAGLSPQQRAVVVLSYFEDLTETDTAAALGCSVGTVKAPHSRAIAHLRPTPRPSPSPRARAS